MRRKIDDIEIKEPPLEELGKKHSCFKRTCVSCCGFFIILIIGSLIVLKFAVGPKTKVIKQIPRIVSATVPVYDPENTEMIVLTSGEERSQSLELIAIIPKLVISPFIIYFDKDYRFIRSYLPELEEPLRAEKTKLGQFVIFMKKPVADHRDMLKINWYNLSADAEFIDKYYETELRKKDFAVAAKSTSSHITQFAFMKDNIDGTVYIEDNPTTPFTDKVELTITLDVGE